MSSPAGKNQTPTLSQNVRSFISLWLVIHGFMIAVTFFSVYPPAAFQTRLLGVLSGYVQLLNFDLDLSPYYLTSDDLIASPEGFQQFTEREYFVEALPKGETPDNAEAWFRVGDTSMRWTEQSRRIQRVGFSARAADLEEWQAELVTGLARLAESQSGEPINRIRVRQHVPVPQEVYTMNTEFDPQDPSWFRTVYEAIVVNGKILPVVDSRETAGAVGSGASAAPATPAPAGNSVPSALSPSTETPSATNNSPATNNPEPAPLVPTDGN